MIQFKKVPVTSDGIGHPTLEQAQRHELATLLNIEATAIVDAIIQNADKVVDILTTSESSRAKARRVNGGTKPRKAKATAQPEPQPTTA